MNIFLTFICLAKRFFLNISVVLILFVLPFDLLFRLSSWTLFMPYLDILDDVSMMVLLLSFVSVVMGGALAGIVALLVYLFQKVTVKADEILSALVSVGLLGVLVVFITFFLGKWYQQVSGVTVSAGAMLLVAFMLIGLFILGFRKLGLIAAGDLLKVKLAKGNFIVLVFIVLSGIMVAMHGVSLHDYHEIKVNPITAPRANMPNVILLTIDALTAEDMALYGYHLPTTPKLNDFANTSYVFDNYFSSSNWTTPSVASFISGMYPITNGVHQINSYFLEQDRKKNIAQLLTNNGYQTAAIVANDFAQPLTLQISDSFSVVTESPIREIFQETDSIFTPLYRIKSFLYRMKNCKLSSWIADIKNDTVGARFNNISSSHDEKNSFWPPEPVFNRSMPFLLSLKKPSFIWTHIFPPHEPFLPAAPFKYTFGNFKEFSTANGYIGYGGKYSDQQQDSVNKIRLRYDEFILDTDSRVGTFLEKLRAMGRFDDSIIIITADHGQSFTKDFLYHGGSFLHQPLIHIPMMIHLPGQKEGKRISSYAGQVDLLPTVMDLLNLPIPSWAEGESLKSVMLKRGATRLPKFSMNLDLDSRFSPPTKGTFAVMQDGWKFVRYLASGKEELYHLAIDPQEDHDLAISNPEKSKQMRELIYARFKLGK